MSDEGFWSGVAVMGVLAGSLYYCSRDKDNEETTPTPTDYSALAVDAAAGASSDVPYVPSEPPAPTPNYSDKEGNTYFYVAAVSEDERKRGQASGTVNQYQYGGKDASGAHIVFAPGMTYTCGVPCKIIKASNGGRLAYNEGSIIGAVFQDAMRGFLKPLPKAPKPKPIVEEPTPVGPWEQYKDAPEVAENPSEVTTPDSVPAGQ